MMGRALEADIETVVHQSFTVETVGDTEFGEDVDGRVLDDARADS